MFALETLHARHEAAILAFEREGRAWFGRSVPDRGDGFFNDHSARFAALLAEQDAGYIRMHVLVDDAGAVLGRFNLVDVDGGSAELGFRIAERVVGRGLGRQGVGQVCALAHGKYGLDRLTATADRSNSASLAVLRATGFTVVDEQVRGGVLVVHHVLDLRSP